jgi:DNA (cytosine-5)-methyltransferase 1
MPSGARQELRESLGRLRLNVLSLCSGVGGLDLGVELATGGVARTVCYVEREAHAAAVLVARMEEALLAPAAIWCDLTTFDGTEWRGVVDLVVAGYPCQPFSTAGKRAGVDDPRHLWPHVARIIRECGAGLVLLENVPGHLSLGFDQVCRDLQGMDYRVAAGLFSAAEVGASHKRERLFILAASMAHPMCGGLKREAEVRQACVSRTHTKNSGTEHRSAGNRDVVAVWPPGPNASWAGVPEHLWPSKVQPEVCGVADGMAPWVDRLRACGNGVVPLAAAHAFRTLTAALVYE